jgi:hypothetical protein
MGSKVLRSEVQEFRVQGSEVQGSMVQGSAQPLAAEMASLIEKVTSSIHSAIFDCGSGFC